VKSWIFPRSSQNSAFTVKSRRSASPRQSEVKATRALRPSVSTSWRKVVTSKPRFPEITVTVPWSMPVGCTFSPAFMQAAVTASGASGGQSMSAMARPGAHCARAPPPRLAARRRRREDALELRLLEPAGLCQ
jgi:hypothetical protein